MAAASTSVVPPSVIIVGAGAAGLMAARVLARAGRAVTVLEARDRCGGRIHTLPAATFGYPAEEGAEFVHGEAPVTRALAREAGLTLTTVTGSRWWSRDGTLVPDDAPWPHAGDLFRALETMTDDLPVAAFLDTHFSEPRHEELRRRVTRMVEGYDAADPARVSTLAMREEWMGRGLGSQDRVAGGYGALIRFLATDASRHGATIRLGARVTAIETADGRVTARCADGGTLEAARLILTVPLPVLATLALPPDAAAIADAMRAQIGFGNVVKLLLRFPTPWWKRFAGRPLDDLSFMLSWARIPTWWTQYPQTDPVLTGWFGGPRTREVGALTADQLVDHGVGALAEIFGLPVEKLRADLVIGHATNWANDPLAGGAYSYATPETRPLQTRLERVDGGPVLFSGEALYQGRDMGTVEAALASGEATARAILASGS